MPALLQELPSRVVASLFQEIGIGDATALMAMMPTRALLSTFDESIWRSPSSGLPERIDVGELLEWLEAWLDIGESFLLEKLEAINEEYLTTMLSRIVTVESMSRHAIYGEHIEGLVDLLRDERERFGPFIVEPSVEGGEIVTEVVRALWIADPQKFLRIFGRMSDLPNPDDCTRGSAPTLHDVEFERESFREANGFVTADGARAFFSFAERLTPSEIESLDRYDAETQRYIDRLSQSSATSINGIDPVLAEGHEEVEPSGEFLSKSSPEASSNTASLREQLEASQLLPKQNSIPLLRDTISSKEAALTAILRRLAGEDIDSFHARARELAYLANALRWLPTDDDSLSDTEAREAAFAICNLGVALAGESVARELDKEPGLIRFFLFGWNSLSSIRGRAIGAFSGALSRSQNLAPWLLSEATSGLSDLRRALEAKRYSDARESLLFLSIVFDSSLCHALSPLMNAVPRFSTALEGGKSTGARWIETKADIRTIERVLESIRLKRERP